MNKNASLKTRLNALYERETALTGNAVSDYKVSKKTGVGQSTIQRIRSGESQTPSAEKLYRIAKFFGVPLDYFFSSEWKEILDRNTVPLVNKTPGGAVDSTPKLVNPNTLGAAVEKGEKYRLLCNSDSNEPVIPSNSILTIDPKATPTMGNFVVYAIDNKPIMGRYVFGAEEGEIIRFCNSDYSDIKIKGVKNCLFCGVITEYSKVV